jgi:hypothetical protein
MRTVFGEQPGGTRDATSEDPIAPKVTRHRDEIGHLPDPIRDRTASSH